MKYIKCTVLVGIPDEEWDTYSEGVDITFHGVGHFHNPEKYQFLIQHDNIPCSQSYVDKVKYSIFTEEGGI